MKTFKQWLVEMAYDIGLQDHWYVNETSWGKTRKVDVFKLVAAYVKDCDAENAHLRKELTELRAEFILRDEEYNNLQEQYHEERNETTKYIKELRQYEE